MARVIGVLLGAAGLVLLGLYVPLRPDLAFVVVGVWAVAIPALAVGPRLLFLALAVMLPFRVVDMWLGGVVPVANVGVSEILLMAFVASSLLRHGIRGRHPSGLLMVLGGMFLGWVALGALLSPHTALAIRKTGRIALVLGALYAGSRSLRLRDVEKACTVVVRLTVLVVLVDGARVLLDFAGIPVGLWQRFAGVARLSGAFPDPNHYGFYLGMVLAFLVGRSVIYGLSPGRRNTFVVLGLGVLLTMSRGGSLGALAGLAVVLAVALWARLRTRRPVPLLRGSVKAGTAVSAGVVAIALLSPAIAQALGDRFSFEGGVTADPTANLRLQIWESGFDLLRRSPVMGIGPGSYRAAMEKLPEWARGWEAHNSLLETLVETGVVGGILLCLFLALGLYKSAGGVAGMIRSSLVGARPASLAVGLFGAVVAGVASSFGVSNVLYWPHLVFFAAALAAVLSAPPARAGEGFV